MSIASVRELRRLAALTAMALALALLALPAQAAEESAAALQKRCDAKQADACVELGYRLEYGKGMAKDASQALALYQQACDLKSGFGCKSVADAFKNGEGVAADAARAAGLYGKACDLEEAEACVELAMMHEKGEGVPKDASRFDSLFERGCKLGSGVCQDIAYFHHVLPYEGDCAKGDAEACSHIGDAYYGGPDYLIVKKDKAAEHFRKACDGNYAQACFMLGLLHSEGDGVNKDAAKANELFRKAGDLSRKGCDGNSKDASWDCRRLGTLYKHGLGVAADPARAKILYDKSCQLGDKEACSLQVADAAAPRPKPSVAAAPSTSAPAPTAAAPAAAAPATNCKLVNVVLGVDTVASVERDILRRGGTPSIGGNDRVNYRRLSSLSGDYSDGGPEIMAVNYDFDAGPPSGKLVTVTVVRKVAFGPPLNKLLADRKAYLTTAFGTLKSKSANESTGSRPGCTVALTGEPDTGYLYEVYSFAN